MSLTRSIILERLRGIQPLLRERYGVVILALFGSFARSEQTESSDIDILVALPKPDFRAFSAVAQLLSELFPERRVEVVSKGAIRPEYMEAIQPDLAYA